MHCNRALRASVEGELFLCSAAVGVRASGARELSLYHTTGGQHKLWQRGLSLQHAVAMQQTEAVEASRYLPFSDLRWVISSPPLENIINPLH